MSGNVDRRTFLHSAGAAGLGLGLGLAGCTTAPGTGGSEDDTPEVLVVVGYPQSGVQIFKDYYADYGPDDADILVTDGLRDTDLPANVGSPMENVQGTAPSAAGPGRQRFTQLYNDEFGSEPGVFTSHAYDATATQILANLVAGENDGTAVRDHVPVVANAGGTEVTPENLAEGVAAAAAGENVQYSGASSGVDFDGNGDITAATYERFGFQEGGGIESLDTVDFEASGEIPQPEPQGSGSDAGRTVRFGILQPETGDLGPLGTAIADAATLPAVQLEGEVDFDFDYQRGDTQSKAQPGIDAADSLVSAGYPSITGAASSETTIQAARSVFVDSRVTAISPASTSPTITGLDDDGYLFRTPPSDALQGQVLAQVATEELDAGAASTFYLNNSYGQALADSFVSAFEERGGTVVAEVSFEQQQSSYTSKLNQAMTGG